MLTLTRSQLEQISVSMALKTKARVRAKWLKFWPLDISSVPDQAEADRFIEAALKACSRYGIKTEKDILRFLNVMSVLGPGFDELHLWAGSILKDDSLRPARKLRVLVERTRTLLLEESKI